MEKELQAPLLGREGKMEYENRPIRSNKMNARGSQINCSGCNMLLESPNGAFCIRCPKCLQITAVTELSTLTCIKCNCKMVFPANSPTIQCSCGQIYGSMPQSS